MSRQAINFHEKLELPFRWGARCLIAIAVLNLAAMMLHVCADVIMKYVFNSPIPGTAEIVAYYYIVAAVFLPLPLVELGNKSISVDLFWNNFHAWIQRSSAFLAYGAQVAFFTILALRTGEDALRSLARNELVEGIIPVLIWPGRFFLPAAFWLATFVSVLRMAQVACSPHWRELTSHRGNEEAK
ncbi:TRAP transporter small permease [Billgrantia pellis]|uniref:TRAP transporter small permease protein n=1 Tax=Billgrantia pellis TaxID=2606936 RepID=A0A7V7G2Y0_9GAMM|nr:TRAP transporter small permease [Halomonas pellis]KAA0014589.1 TRAP transporter small permease [Halomonas pellis]